MNWRGDTDCDKGNINFHALHKAADYLASIVMTGARPTIYARLLQDGNFCPCSYGLHSGRVMEPLALHKRILRLDSGEFWIYGNRRKPYSLDSLKVGTNPGPPQSWQHVAASMQYRRVATAVSYKACICGISLEGPSGSVSLS